MRVIRGSLGWKLGASFGALVALLAVVAQAHRCRPLQSVQLQTSEVVTPKLLAADALRSAAADQHFSQTQWVFQNGAGRADYLADHHVFGQALASTAQDLGGLVRRFRLTA